MRQYGSKQPSKRARTMSLQALLMMVEDLDRVSIVSLVRSYGLGEQQTVAMLDHERARRV